MSLRVEVQRAQRTERRKAIVGFMSATDRIEQNWEYLAAHNASVIKKIPELLHDMWLSKKVIELVCSGELAQIAHDYALDLNHHARELLNTGQSEHQLELRTIFLERARIEMGYKGEPMQRRTLRADHLHQHEQSDSED